MIIKYCPTCSHEPYTKDKKQHTCPICGSELLMEAVQPDELKQRPKLGETEHYDNHDDFLDVQDIYENNEPNMHTSAKDADEANYNVSVSKKAKESNYSYIIGRVLEYSNTDQEGSRYHRNFIEKIYQALVYGQRTDDILHRFTIRQNNGEDGTGFLMTRDITVNIHGIITDGANIHENSEIRATGKYKGSVFYAKKLEVMDGSYGREVHFQRSPSTMIFAAIAAILGLLLLGTIIADLISGNAFSSGSRLYVFTQKRYWILTLILFAVLAVLIMGGKFSHFGMMMMFSGKKVNLLTPMIILFIVSMALGYLLYGFIWGGGIINLFGSLLGLLMPIIVLIGIFLMIKSIF